jgi:hypothetical protein
MHNVATYHEKLPVCLYHAGQTENKKLEVSVVHVKILDNFPVKLLTPSASPTISVPP